MILFLFGVLVGSLFGVMLMAICAAGKKEEILRDSMFKA